MSRKKNRCMRCGDWTFNPGDWDERYSTLVRRTGACECEDCGFFKTEYKELNNGDYYGMVGGRHRGVRTVCPKGCLFVQGELLSFMRIVHSRSKG